MKKLQRIALWAAIVYAAVWFGGHVSYYETRDCVSSHTLTSEEFDIQVCDEVRDNGKRWDLFSPIVDTFSLYW